MWKRIIRYKYETGSRREKGRPKGKFNHKSQENLAEKKHPEKSLKGMEPS